MSVGKALLFDHSRAELKLVFEGVEFEPLAVNTARGLDDLEAMIVAARANGYATADEEMEPGRLGRRADP